MANNIFQNQITPVKPKVLESERIYVYVPTATKDIQGVASYNTRDFGVNNGHVSLIWPKQLSVEQLSNPLIQVSNIKVLADEFVNTNNIASITNPVTGVTYNSNTAEVKLNRQLRDAFVRPELVMLDDKSDFETSIDENKYVKYTLKRNNPLEQPSLIQVSPADFIRENNIVKLNWTNIEDTIKDIVAESQIDGEKLELDISNITTNVTKIGDSGNNFATKGGTIADGIDNAVQLGEGTNNESGTFKFRHYTLIDKDGKVYTNSGNAAAITMKLVATEDFVRDLFSTLKAVTLKKVDVLPVVGETNIIYMVPAVDKENSKDYYEEYIYVENRWELIGTTKVDMSNIYTKVEVDDLLLTAHKQVILGADGVAEDNVYNFTVESPEAYLPYRTNGTKFLVDLALPIAGNLDLSRKVAITFGDTVYYVYNILSGNEPATIGDLGQVDKYNNATGYRFIAEMTFFETGDIEGFAIIPTISMSDVLSLTSDEMDHYLAEGGLSQGQLAICSKLIHNGYVEGALYRFDIHYPNTYTWTTLSKNTTITRVTDTDITTTEYKGKVELSEEQYNTLIKEGKVEVNGKMIEYSDDEEYLTPDTSYSIKIGATAPTPTVEGDLGQFYLDNVTKKLYVCIENMNSSYTWKLLTVEEALDRLGNLETIITELTPEVARALKLPVTTPIELKLVGVNTSNNQEMLAIGNYLSAENNRLDLNDTAKTPITFAESERQKSKNLFDGKFKVGCYRFADGIYDGSNTDYICTDFISVKPNETITFSYKGIDWTDSSGFVFFNNGAYVSTSTTLTAVVPAGANQVAYNIFGTGIANNMSSVLEPQLEYGSAATKYQPYNGAIMHNTDAPVAFAESERQKSKNLLNWEKLVRGDADNLVQIDGDGQFSFNGTFYYADIRLLDASFIKKNQEYTFSEFVSSYTISDSGSVFGEFVIRYTDDTYLLRSFTVTPNTRASITFTPEKEVSIIDIRFLRKNENTSTLTGVVKDLMLCEGTDTEYQPYNGTIVHENDKPVAFAESEREKSKNLFNYESYLNLIKTRDYLLGDYYCKKIQLKPFTTYTVSCPTKAETNIILLIHKFQQVNAGGYFDTRKTNDVKTFTTDETGCLYIGEANSTDDKLNSLLSSLKLQIEEGSVATEYQPYNGAIVHEKQLNDVLNARPNKILLFTNDKSNVHSATIDASAIAEDDIIEVQFMGSEVIKTRFKYSMLTTDFNTSSTFVNSSGKLITNTQYFTISRNSAENTITFTYSHYNQFMNDNGTITATVDKAPSSAQWIRRIYKVVD